MPPARVQGSEAYCGALSGLLAEAPANNSSSSPCIANECRLRFGLSQKWSRNVRSDIERRADKSEVTL